MKKNIIFSVILALLPLVGNSQNLTDDDLKDVYTTRSYSKRVSVHDPSIIHDPADGKYYIYGSHLARAYTTASANYQDWTKFSSGETSSNTEYSSQAVTKVKNYEGVEVDFPQFDPYKWQNSGYRISGNQWAPDIVWNKTMKKWCMYISINGDKWCSSIVCLTSDKVSGPWKYQGLVICSGFNGAIAHNGYAATDDWKRMDLAIATGATTLPARYKPSGTYGDYWPNCIDPCVFYDDDDNLWMSYGSWSGGIFIIRLNPENGLRDYEYQFPYQVNNTTTTPGSANKQCTSDPYFGKKIAGGCYVSGEASYIKKIGNYYYLFMSYGGLSAYASDYYGNGYQMRVFRSDKPDGPYKDCNSSAGNNAIFTSYVLNFGSNATTDRGVRIMSCYKWDTMPNAELAQGHNSATVDAEGRALLVYHTRFNNGTEGHQVRVHQLFQNEDGWLVACPYEYNGETTIQNDIDTKQMFTTEDVIGTYQIILHKSRQNPSTQEYATPVSISLHEDGTVSGEHSGTWAFVPGTSYINITLKGAMGYTGDTTFKGVLTRQTVDFTNIPAVCFTAIGATGRTSNPITKGICLWGSKVPAKAAIAYTRDKMSIPFNDGQTVASDIELPSKALLGANITWSSDNEDVITNDGKVVGNGTATLTMEIEKDGEVYRRSYTLTVNADGVAAPEPLYLLDFENAAAVTDFGGTQYGSGTLVTENGVHGQYYQNMPNATASTVFKNYLAVKPSNNPWQQLVDSNTDAFTIAFWCNATVANTKKITNEWGSLFTGYTESGTLSTRAWPYPVGPDLRYGGQFHYNNNGYCDNNHDATRQEVMKWSKDNSWHHFAWVFSHMKDKGSFILTLYVDGTQKYSVTESISNGSYGIDMLKNLDRFVIGGASPIWSDPDNAYGYDDIAIYSSALTQDEVKAAIKEKNTPVVRGDANNDGAITVSDIVAIANHILGNTPTGFNLKNADMNNDGVITVSDIVVTAQSILNQ